MRTLAIAVVALLVFSTNALGQVPEESPESKRERISYSVGMDIVQRLKVDQINLSPEYMAKGFYDMLLGETALTPEEAQEVIAAWREEEKARQAVEREREMQRLALENLKAGAAFLRENRDAPGVVTLSSGLQYKIIEQGDGPKPDENDTVLVHYKGHLLDGTVFDSSYKRGQPLEFKVNGVIPGWTQGLQLMPVGSKYTLYIPSTLAYGNNQPSREITPHSTLIFEIELLDIVEEGDGDEAQ
jgi:FKBP-type peptidyl-prolyl cis-trans isomerase